MTDQDALQQHLAKLQEEDKAAAEKRVALAGKLPGRLGEMARSVVDPNYESLESERAWAIAESEARQLLTTMMPKLTAEVEHAWDAFAYMPYDTGYARKAFRLPGNQRVIRDKRAWWARQMLHALKSFDRDAAWLAAWTPHLSMYVWEQDVAVLLTASMDGAGPHGDEVFEVLCDTATGDHPIGSMGYHVAQALLSTSRPEGWEFIEKMLLAAQRQEGLRQTILESVDQAHPEAFRRMLRLILEHNLVRFSSVVRAVDVWFGLGWDSVSAKVVQHTIERVDKYLNDAAARDAAVANGEAEDAYLALWTLAYDNAEVAIRAASGLLGDGDVERRFVAVHLLGQLQLLEATEALVPMCDDPDLRVALRALQACCAECLDWDAPHSEENVQEEIQDAMMQVGAQHTLPVDVFDATERLLGRVSKKTTLKPIVWPWHQYVADPQNLAGTLILHRGKRPATELIRFLPRMDVSARHHVIAQLTAMREWTAETRETLVTLAGDPSSFVRQAAVDALGKCDLEEHEAQRLESLLSRKAADLRRGVLALLSKLPDDAALRSADRLLSAKSGAERAAGLELLRLLKTSGRAATECESRARAYVDLRKKVTAEEQGHLDVILAAAAPEWTLENALGLMDPARCTKPPVPQDRGAVLASQAGLEILRALDELVAEHANDLVPVYSRRHGGDGDSEQETDAPKTQELFGNLQWEFPVPRSDVPIADEIRYLPLAEIWQTWWKERPSNLRDQDGLELLRASVMFSNNPECEVFSRHPALRKRFFVAETPKSLAAEVKYPAQVSCLLAWLERMYPSQGKADFVLDAAETSLSLVPEDEIGRKPSRAELFYPKDRAWREHGSPFIAWLERAWRSKRR